LDVFEYEYPLKVQAIMKCTFTFFHFRKTTLKQVV
jgi:hypothetical protein